MATEKAKRKSTAQVFDVEMIPVPPGTKSRGRLRRGDEPDPIPTRAWWFAGGMAVVALIIGLAIGRFLL
jgi:hypothetical protein